MAALRGLAALRVLVAATVTFVVLAIVPASAQAPQQNEPEARIVVSGEGSVIAAPDSAQIRGGVITKAKTAAEATGANAKLMASVIAALTNAGIAHNDIQTAQFSLQPVYAQPQAGSDQKLIGFSASNQLTVKIRQLDKLGDVLDRMVAAGASDAGNVAFEHSDLSKVLDQAREAAVADARRKAELYAHAAGVTLGNVVWISESSGYASPPVFARALAPSAMAAPTPIMSGEDTLRVHISVGFAIAH